MVWALGCNHMNRDLEAHHKLINIHPSLENENIE